MKEKLIFKISRFFKKNINLFFILIATIVAMAIVFGVVYHKHLVNKEENAAVALFPGQEYFSRQEWSKALNGDCLGYSGLLNIVNKFKGTKSANLAKVYAGICCYKLEKYEKAIAFFKSYHGRDKILRAQIFGAIGDCEVNLGNIRKSVMFFKKAAFSAKSSYLSPIYLKKAAIACEFLKDYRLALEIYTSISILYPKYLESNSIEKYIYRIKNTYRK